MKFEINKAIIKSKKILKKALDLFCEQYKNEEEYVTEEDHNEAMKTRKITGLPDNYMLKLVIY